MFHLLHKIKETRRQKQEIEVTHRRKVTQQLQGEFLRLEQTLNNYRLHRLEEEERILKKITTQTLEKPEIDDTRSDISKLRKKEKSLETDLHQSRKLLEEGKTAQGHAERALRKLSHNEEKALELLKMENAEKAFRYEKLDSMALEEFHFPGQRRPKGL